VLIESSDEYELGEGGCGRRLSFKFSARQKLKKTQVVAEDALSIRLAIYGAHITGRPPNHPLPELDATPVETTIIAPCDRLYVLPGARRTARVCYAI
jgi:hypothetical protein